MSGDTFGPEVDPAMAIVSNRLPYMDLNEFIAENNFAYFITWRAWAFDELRIDDQQEGKGYGGAFAKALIEQRIRLKTQSGTPEGLAGRIYKNRADGDTGFATDLQTEEASETDGKIKALAAEHGIRGAWAIWRDGAIYEFGSHEPMPGVPAEIVAGIGGSTGVRAAATAVMAAVKLGKLKKKATGGDAA